MSTTIADAEKLIQERISELDDERKQLQQALTALTPAGSSRRARSSGGASRRGRSASKRGRRSLAPRGQRQQQLLDYLGKHADARPSEIARSMGVSSANIQNVLRKAREQGLVEKGPKGYRLTAKSSSS